MQYRTHERGPLTTISVEPGKVVITMDFDLPGSFTRMHSHEFDHWMVCESGKGRIELDGAATIINPGDRYFVAAHKRHGFVPLMRGTKVRCEHENPDVHPDKALDGIPAEWVARLTHPQKAHA